MLALFSSALFTKVVGACLAVLWNVQGKKKNRRQQKCKRKPNIKRDIIRTLRYPGRGGKRERRKPGVRTPPPSREKQIKIEQVGWSARLTRREDKVMLSCFNSISREVLLDWYLNDLLLEEKFVLPAMTPVSLKKNRISSRETWGYDRSSGYQLFVARLFRFPLF